MTREEYVKWLKQLDESLEFDGLIDGDKEVDLHEMIFDLCEMLEQQTCEDYISRQAVIRINELHHGEMPNHINHQIWEEIKALPSVTPQPKIGHWEKMVEVYDLQQNRMLVPYGYDDAKFGNTPVYVCDCGCESNKNSRFCPDCGVRMLEPQESEVEE